MLEWIIIIIINNKSILNKLKVSFRRTFFSHKYYRLRFVKLHLKLHIRSLRRGLGPKFSVAINLGLSSHLTIRLFSKHRSRHRPQNARSLLKTHFKISENWRHFSTLQFAGVRADHSMPRRPESTDTIAQSLRIPILYTALRSAHRSFWARTFCRRSSTRRRSSVRSYSVRMLCPRSSNRRFKSTRSSFLPAIWASPSA